MRFTLAYWISVMFLLGSIFFCLGSANKLLEAYGGRLVQVWPNLLGGVAYTVGCYLSYVQLINMPTRKAESLRLVCADWNKVSERVDVPSTIGTIAFLAGAILFQIACVADFADVPTHADIWIGVPNFIGSLLFTVGGVCEILLNRTGATAMPEMTLLGLRPGSPSLARSASSRVPAVPSTRPTGTTPC